MLGVDLAWGEGSSAKVANESGVVAVDLEGNVLDAGWTCGLDETLGWMESLGGTDALAMIDAPLVVTNHVGQRTCERHTGERYGRWKVSANSTNLSSPRLAGQVLRTRLEARGWTYDPGWSGPPEAGRWLSECYPYATLVGAEELGYDLERPVYKRKPKGVPVAEFRVRRAGVCDDLVRRLCQLAGAEVPLKLRSHPVTALLLDEASPLEDRAYKHREDLIDAAICAWTGLLWLGGQRCQVLGDPGNAATIIAPARPEQRRWFLAGGRPR